MPMTDFSQEKNGTPEAPAVPAALPAKDSGEPVRMELHIPRVTFLKIFAALLIGCGIYVLWPLLLLVFLALFLAVTLSAFVDWLNARGMPHWGSLLTVIGSLLTVLGVSLALIIPALFDQASIISESLPRLREEALQQLPVSGAIRQNLEQLMEKSNWSQAGTWISHVWSAGG